MAQVTETKLRSWLEESYRVGSSHMLLVVDRSEDFVINPVKVFPHENVSEIYNFYNSQYETEVVEVYNMSLSLEHQLKSSAPVFNY